MTHLRSLYDLGGFNEYLFRSFNEHGGTLHDAFADAFRRFGDANHFVLWLIAVASLGIWTWLVHRNAGEIVRTPSLRAYLGVLTVMFFGFELSSIIVEFCQAHFPSPSPFFDLGPNRVRLIGDVDPERELNRSFPSLNAAFITVMVFGLSPMLTSFWSKLIGAVLWYDVLWAQMATGMSFPSDVAGGVVIAAVSLVIVRQIVYRILRRMGRYQIH